MMMGRHFKIVLRFDDECHNATLISSEWGFGGIFGIRGMGELRWSVGGGTGRLSGRA